jgi:hypothetical protein
MSFCSSRKRDSEPSLNYYAAIPTLLEFPEDWITRRVERMEFLDDEFVRRSVSVDFRLPNWYLELDTGVGDQFVPIAMLAKRPLVDFDLRGEDDRALPLADSRRTAKVATGALLASANGALEQFHRTTTEEIASDLQRAASCSIDEADEAVSRVFERHRGSETTRRLLARDARLDKLLRELSENFLVLTPVEKTAERRVLKFTYLERLRFENDGFWVKMGWSSPQFRWHIFGASMAASYHCEVEAPKDLEITFARLRAGSEGEEEDEPAWEKNVSGVTAMRRVHLYVSEVPSDTNAVLIADLRSDRRSMARPAVLFGLAVSILLTAGIVFRQGVSKSSETAAVVLVAIPALLAVYLVRPDEHKLASRLLSGLRWLIAGIGSLAFVAAASLVAHFNPNRTLLAIWLPITALSWLATLGLLASAILPRKRHD